jgi:hypothetical protein
LIGWHCSIPPAFAPGFRIALHYAELVSCETRGCTASETGDDPNKVRAVRQSNALRRSHSPFAVDKNRRFVAADDATLQTNDA